MGPGIISAARRRTAIVSDPSYSSVVLLCGFDGMADGEQGVPLSQADETTPQNGFAVGGSAQVDTAQSKFGTGSLLLDGVTSNSRLQCSPATTPAGAFDLSGDFTMEAWVRNAANGNNVILAQWDGSVVSAKKWAFYAHAGGNIYFLYYNTGGTLRIVQGAWTPTTGTWYHYAVTRSGNDFRLFVDGVQKGTTTTFADAISSSASAIQVTVGWLNDNGTQQIHNGWIDELRFTNGVARYTSNFSPPTAKFPRS